MYGQAICYIFTKLKLSFASIDFHAEMMVQGPFLESPSNVSGPKSNIQTEI